jgi:2'-5' RNA ligase
MQQSVLPGFEPPPLEIHNLFFALLPDDATCARIAAIAERLRHDHPIQGRWLKPPRYHLTLRFLGEYPRLPADLVANACAAAACVRAPAFVLPLDTVGNFAGAHVCWLGCAQPPQALLALFDRLGTALHEHGCRVVGSARLVPHVTLLRDAHAELDFPLTPAVPWRIDEFVLIDSQTRPFLPYRILGRWLLG